MIARNIFQIYHDKSLIPSHVKTHITKLNPSYTYYFYDFVEGKEIIKKNFGKDLSSKIINTLDSLPRYCHKSDLLRYCLLYIYGGVYIDCDLKPLISFDEMIEEDITFFTSFGRGPTFGTFFNKDKCLHKIMANGILATTKNNSLLFDLINVCMLNPINSNPNNRGYNVVYLYIFLNEKINGKDILDAFKKQQINDQIIYLITQYDNRQYGQNCFIDSNNRVIINPNDTEYEFKRQTSGYINV
tara:strand:- start:231 stop:959 length:729 start_codon:yes stop_codon:yes gene_type:complete